MTDLSDIPPEEQIGRYLELAQQARKNAKSPYAGLFAAMPPDPQTTVIKEFAILYAIVGGFLFLAALIAVIQNLFANTAVRSAA